MAFYGPLWVIYPSNMPQEELNILPKNAGAVERWVPP